ncbi:MAG: hypothetical protein KAR21_14380 [Spirochaetales bacterium]|nr:hypothetical protein [Spirochaetales bacterium]
MMIRWLVLLCLVVIFPLDGSETDVAILVRGPVKSMGFPLLYPNAIDIWSGYYRYMESEVIVSFTRENILIPNEWEFAVCGEIKGFSPDKLSFFYKDNEWSLLFQFPAPPPESPSTSISNPNVHVSLVGTPCTFIKKFIIRFKYFIRDASPQAPPLLPAILEF